MLNNKYFNTLPQSIIVSIMDYESKRKTNYFISQFNKLYRMDENLGRDIIRQEYEYLNTLKQNIIDIYNNYLRTTIGNNLNSINLKNVDNIKVLKEYKKILDYYIALINIDLNNIPNKLKILVSLND